MHAPRPAGDEQTAAAGSASEVPGHRPHRPGRDGDGLPRLRRGPGARGRRQDPDRRGHASTRRAASASRSRPRRRPSCSTPTSSPSSSWARTAGVPFIAMELLAGRRPGGAAALGRAAAPEEKLDVMVQVCRGLHYAHEHRVVHRDIKPSNIRVLEDGTAKIMDFGIAKLGAHRRHQDGHDGGHRPLHEPGADPRAAARRAQRRLLGRA